MKSFLRNYVLVVFGLCIVSTILASVFQAGRGPFDLPWAAIIFLIGLFVIATGLFVEAINGSRHRRRVTHELQQRAPLDDESFGRTYFGESEDRAAVAADLRRLAQENVRIPLDGLHPDNRLEDLGLIIDDPCFLMDLDRLFGIVVSPDWRNSSDELKRVETFRDFVNYVEQKLKDRLSKPMHLREKSPPAAADGL